MATAASQGTSATSTPSFEVPSVDAAAQRIRDLNERLIEMSKSAGLTTLDAYEKALQSLADFEEKVASATQLDWVSALATTQAKFITDLTSSYTKAARDLIK